MRRGSAALSHVGYPAPMSSQPEQARAKAAPRSRTSWLGSPTMREGRPGPRLAFSEQVAHHRAGGLRVHRRPASGAVYVPDPPCSGPPAVPGEALRSVASGRRGSFAYSSTACDGEQPVLAPVQGLGRKHEAPAAFLDIPENPVSQASGRLLA